MNRGDYIQVFSGRHLYPLDPREDEISIEDIAHALAHVCRFGGHVREHYSVAQHCVLVSLVVHPAVALEGLLHDATEAYLGDMVRPLKNQMPEFSAVEANLEAFIASMFGLQYPWPEAVRHADNVLLVTEARDVLAVAPTWLDRIPAKPLTSIIKPWPASEAKRAFLHRFTELQLARATSEAVAP